MTRDLKFFLFILLVLILAAGVVYTLVSKGYLSINNPSVTDYPVRGIDVSHFQESINWNVVSKSDVQFAFIKATEGGDFVDDRFMENWNSARENNILTGAYHFYTFCKSGKLQAENFISVVPKEKNSLPPVIDLEFGGNCKLSVSDEVVTAEIMDMNHRLFEHYQKQPILYVTYAFYKRFIAGKFLANPIWIRDVVKKPKLKDHRQWTFWQYNNKGKVPGIQTSVDLNVFNGTAEEFENFVGE